MKYLITGGGGFLGSNIASEVLRRGDDLSILDNLSRLGATENIDWLKSQGEFRFIHADVRNQNDVERAIREVKPEAIFHLAGQVAMTTSVANPRMDFEINAFGTLNLLEAVRLYSPQSCVVYSSTNKVYGDLEWLKYEEHEKRYTCKEYPNGLPETIPLDFHSPYGTSKGSADQYVLDYARTFDLTTVVFRHSSMFGGRQFATYDQGWIGWFCEKALETRQGGQDVAFTISGNGKQVRDILYATDMVSLYLKAAEKATAIEGQAFNIGGGIENSLSLLELFDFLEEVLDIKLKYTQLPPRKSDQRVFVADISKTHKMLDWAPTVSATEGIRSMIDWVASSKSRSMHAK